jgi:type II secretory pathway pseudopilin PulG
VSFRNQKGFTLTEIMIAAGVAVFLIIGAAQLMVTQSQLQASASSLILTEGDLLLMEDYFVRKISAGGGNSLSPWNSYWVEDACAARGPFPACDSSDRLTIVDSISASTCAVTGSTPSGLDHDLNISNAGGCCLLSLDLTNAQTMLVLGSTYGQRFVTAVDTGACTVHVTPGPNANHDSSPAVVDWTGATISPISIATIYLDTTTNELHSYTYLRNTTSDLIIADQIFDFQAALGFDLPLSDGVVTDTGSTTDEWLYNASGDAWGAGKFSASPQTIVSDSLKMVSVGLITGSLDAKYPAGVPASILNGISRTKARWNMRSALVKTMVRSQSSFE